MLWSNKPSNLVVTSKSYIEKIKALMHNNKAMKGSKTSKKGWAIRFNIHKKIKQNIQDGVVKEGILAKEGEWLKFRTSLEY